MGQHTIKSFWPSPEDIFGKSLWLAKKTGYLPENLRI